MADWAKRMQVHSDEVGAMVASVPERRILTMSVKNEVAVLVCCRRALQSKMRSRVYHCALLPRDALNLCNLFAYHGCIGTHTEANYAYFSFVIQVA